MVNMKNQYVTEVTMCLKQVKRVKTSDRNGFLKCLERCLNFGIQTGQNKLGSKL